MGHHVVDEIKRTRFACSRAFTIGRNDLCAEGVKVRGFGRSKKFEFASYGFGFQLSRGMFMRSREVGQSAQRQSGAGSREQVANKPTTGNIFHSRHPHLEVPER